MNSGGRLRNSASCAFICIRNLGLTALPFRGPLHKFGILGMCLDMSRQIFSEIFSEIPRMSALIMITSRACHCITAHCDPCPRRGDDHDHGGNRG